MLAATLNVAMASSLGLKDEVVEANVNLIAAAPDLLSALSDLIYAIGAEESTDIFCVAARAAIARAKGIV